MERIDRKQFIIRSAQATDGTLLAGPLLARTLGNALPVDPFAFAQVPLPYAPEALEPSIDKLTMEIHYGKHHAAYIKRPLLPRRSWPPMCTTSSGKRRS